MGTCNAGREVGLSLNYADAEFDVVVARDARTHFLRRKGDSGRVRAGAPRRSRRWCALADDGINFTERTFYCFIAKKS